MPRGFPNTMKDFWKRFNALERDEYGCLPWDNSHSVYGVFSIYGVEHHAHRFIYQHVVLKGEQIPDHSNICHRCDRPPCVDPNHLFPGTKRQNAQDAAQKGRMERGEKRHTSKLTEEEVLLILRKFQGLPLVFTARTFDISAQQVSSILNGHSWSYLFSKALEERNATKPL